MVSRAIEFKDQRRACNRADRLGILCSGLCATHCLACPLLFSMAPAIAGASVLTANGADQMMALGSVVFVWCSVGPSFRWAASKIATMLTATGLFLVLLAAFVIPKSCTSTGVRHSTACLCSAYCGIPAGMCVSETIDGSSQLIPLRAFPEQFARSRPHLSFRGWISTSGATLLMIGHLRNLKSRKIQFRLCRQNVSVSTIAADTASGCHGSGMTSTLTSKRC